MLRNVHKNVLTKIQEFMCFMYNNRIRCHKARVQIFSELYVSKRGSFDSKILLKIAARENFENGLRFLYVAQSTSIKCTILNPTEYGWEVCNGRLRPRWFEGESTPLMI